MDVISAIKERRSTRAFRTAPVPEPILQEIVEIAIRAPSWGNIQPWGLAILSGNTMARLKEGMGQRFREEQPERADIPFLNVRKNDLSRQRSRNLSRALYEQTGLPWGDSDARRSFIYSQTLLFDAPHLMVIHVDRELGPWSILDTGLLMQNILLTASEYGLGTCCMAASVQYPDLLRELTGIPESRLIVCGIAIGYPDAEAPINHFRSPREPVDEFVTWHS